MRIKLLTISIFITLPIIVQGLDVDNLTVREGSITIIPETRTDGGKISSARRGGASNDGDLRLGDEVNSNTITINNSKVGINNVSPRFELTISDGVIGIIPETRTDGGRISSARRGSASNDGDLRLGDETDPNTMIINSGKVSIGTTVSNHLLSVGGSIRAEEIIVDTGWADYVFKKDYDLMTLNDVEKFIEKNGHLPNIPNERTVQDNGIGLAEANTLLLAKIEELTLYIIKQQKILDDQDQRLKKLENKN